MSEDNTPAEEIQAPLNENDAASYEALKAEAQGLREQVLRYAAEMENTRRRAEREMNDARAYAIQKFARDLLGVADNLARAMAAAPLDSEDSVAKNFAVGVQMTEKELLAAFERNGLKRIHPDRGEKFDPHKHQAMMEQAGTDVAPGGVVDVMQSGYELLGRLVRPAMVAVAAKAAGKPDGGDGGGGNPYASHEPGEGPGSGGAIDTRA